MNHNSDDLDDHDVPIDRKQEFDLSVPTGNLAEADSGQRPVLHRSGTIEQTVPQDSAESYKAMGWKGIDDQEEEDEDPPVSFAKKDPIPEDELDMTPMVDVTFLLLIFFMVTASFTLQKSIEQPPAASDEASTNVADSEEEQDYVEIVIDQNNTFYVTSRGEEEAEAPSETEMRRLVKDAVETYTPERMVITAHVDSTLDRTIAAFDVGQLSKLAIEIKTTEIEY